MYGVSQAHLLKTSKNHKKTPISEQTEIGVLGFVEHYICLILSFLAFLQFLFRGGAGVPHGVAVGAVAVNWNLRVGLSE